MELWNGVKIEKVLSDVYCTIVALRDSIALLERQKKNRCSDMEKLHAYQDGWQAALEMVVKDLEKDLNIAFTVPTTNLDIRIADITKVDDYKEDDQ